MQIFVAARERGERVCEREWINWLSGSLPELRAPTLEVLDVLLVQPAEARVSRCKPGQPTLKCHYSG